MNALSSSFSRSSLVMHPFGKAAVFFFGILMLLGVCGARGELDVLTSLSPTALLTMDATITEVVAREDSLSITFSGDMVTNAKGVPEGVSKAKTHRVTIQLDSRDDGGAFVLLADKAREMKGKPCTLDIETTGLRYTGSGFSLKFSSSKLDIREHKEHP